MNDNNFIDHIIESVEQVKDGWQVTFYDGWSYFIAGTSPIIPIEGMKARLYGIGNTIRGLYLDGNKVFYRTEEEQKEMNEIELYGKDAQDWLTRWDEGRSVWSIEMGGLGPGYEQCIHVTAAEILRHLLDVKYDIASWDDEDKWKTDREKINDYGFKNDVINNLGLSGAQWGAAMKLALNFYKKGPRAIMKDSQVKNRRIQVEKHFPN